MNALEWLREAERWGHSYDDNNWLFYDYLTPGNATVGNVVNTLDGKYNFEIVDTYYRNIEEETVWTVVRDLSTGYCFKISGEFTSWDSITYEVSLTEPKTVTTTVWS